MFRFAFASMIFLLFILSSISVGQEAASPTSESPAQSDTTSLVVLRISGKPVTERQVLNMIDDVARQMNLSLEKLRQRNALLFKDALNNLITLTLLKDQIVKQNIIVDPVAIEQQVTKIMKQYPTPEAFRKALAAQGISESELKKNLEESIGLQRVIDGIFKNIPPITDADIEKFYNDNPDKFGLPERIHAAHILIRVPSGSTPEQKSAIQKRLEGILADIEANTITFEDAAAKYSQDPASAPKGGDIGTFARGNMVKPFEEAAFGTKPGNISMIVETPYGYHIVKTLEMKPAGKSTLIEAQNAIKQYLEQNAKQTARQKYVDELRSKATIESFMTQEEFINRHPAD
jgi:peptidyl-prolyl cis-trans isomerase C